MATTDSRTGFRLPWSTDRSASREASAEPADSLEATTTETEANPDSGEAPSSQQSSASDQDAPGSAAGRDEEEPVTTLAPDVAPHQTQDEAAAAGLPGASLPAVTDPDLTPGPAAATAGPLPAPSPAPAAGRRPTKFLADLTRAMQAAAEQARTATIDQFRADGTAVMEQIHGRSATGATELRHRADEDVAAIKEWSKAEIARIREETEQRIGSRREQLEGQLERHAALVEHEIEKVRGRIATFEAEMGRFFDDLLRDEDPAVFAARAASLPEPPSFEDVDDDALVSLLREPGLGVPETPDQAVPVAASPEAPATPPDLEAAMEAIQAAAVAAASADAAEAAESADPTDAADSEAVADSMGEADPGLPAMPDADDAAQVAYGSLAGTAAGAEVDPRLAMLGLTPDFEAAEVAAAEAAAFELEEVQEIGDEALAARLSDLVPDASHVAPAPTVTTQVVVTGLVSVASIASFKRHLGRLVGVGHVGVSSGPDGEFVFSVAHDPATSLRELIPTVPGFGARVVGSGDGIVHVSAQDPQD